MDINPSQLLDLTKSIDFGSPTTIAIVAVIVGLATILTTLGSVLGLRRTIRVAKNAGTIKVTTAIGVLVSLGVTIEGAVRLAVTYLHATGIWALLPGVVFETVSVAIGAHAIAWAADLTQRTQQAIKDGEDTEKLPTQADNPYLPWLWRVALVAGLVVGLGGETVREAVARFVFPFAGPLLLHLSLCPAASKKAAEKVKWLISPRRILIRIGWLAPEDRDVSTVHREYQIMRIVALAHKQWVTRDRKSRIATWSRNRRATRIQRLALGSDDDLVADAEARIERACSITQRLDPATIAGNRKRQVETMAATIATLQAENRQLEAEIIAAQEAENRQSAAAQEAATEAANRQAEIGNLRQQLAEAETAIADTDRQRQELLVRLTRAETEAATYRQTATELRTAAPRQPATGNRPTPPIRQRVPATPLPADGALPAIDKVAPETVARVIAAWSGNREARQPEIAALAGVSERTVRTVLTALRNRQPATGNGNPETATETGKPANGNATPDLINVN